MWVFSPGEQGLPEEVRLTWARRSYPIRAGINEIPEPVAQAYFVFRLPPELENNREEYKIAIRQALLRWGMVLKSRPPEPSFLEQFRLAETREHLEKILKEEELGKA